MPRESDAAVDGCKFFSMLRLHLGFDAFDDAYRLLGRPCEISQRGLSGTSRLT